MSEFESMTEALIACVKCCGGSKIVGHKLWPEKPVDAAQRHLLACLNDDKPERLTPDHLLMLMRMGHEKGCHDVMRHIAASVGYAPPIPIEPKDEAAELRRQVLEMGKALTAALSRIEAIEKPILRSAA